MREFLVLVFDIPREKAYLRVKIWRKLQKFGAELRYGSHWTLPFNKENLANMKQICKEIRKSGGKAEVIKGEKVE